MTARRVFLYTVFPLACLVVSGCDVSGRPSARPERGGPEIRIRLVTASALLVSFPGEVDVISLDDRRPLYRSRLPSPCPVTVRDGMLEIGGRRFSTPVRLVYRDGSDRSAGKAVESGEAALAARDDGKAGTAVAGRAVALAEPASETSEGELREAWLHPTNGDRRTFLIATTDPGDEPRRYRGALDLYPRDGKSGKDGKLVAVNALDLETYLAGVIAEEMPAQYSFEALKAQVVASRTYALYSLRLAERQGRSGVFSAGTVFQVYRGVSAEHPRVLQALEQTRGQVLTYLGRLFRAYFHSTCGGQTAAAALAFDEPDIPPLGGTWCGACEDTKFSHWRTPLAVEILDAAVRRRLARVGSGMGVGELRGLEVSDTGPDGRVRYVRVDHSLGSFEWRADRFQRQIEAVARGTIRSTRFHIDRGEKAGDYVVEGRGWGHGVGLCQVGAGRLAKTMDYPEILGRYYPKSGLRKAY